MAARKKSVVFPEVEVDLMNGDKVTVKPWTLRQGRLMMTRVSDLWGKARGSGETVTNLEQLLLHFEQEVYLIVRDTIGWDDEQMDALYYEDVVTLSQAIIETSVYRDEGDGKIGGILGKALGAANKIGLVGGPGLPDGVQNRMDEVRKMARAETEPKQEVSLS